jgi:hypothetical protein
LPTKSNQPQNESQGSAQGDKNREVTNAQLDRMTQDTASVLSSESKETVRLYQVPVGSTDAPLMDEVVQVNGYVYQIPRGQDVEVPQSVAQVLKDAGRI